MGLFPKSVWIFVFVIFLFIFVAMFPTPTIIFFCMMALSALIIVQAIIILRDGV